MLEKNRGQACSVPSLGFFMHTSTGHSSCFHRKETGQSTAVPGHQDFQNETFSFTSKCADQYFWIPVLATCFACLKGFTQKTATRSNSMRKQTLAGFCTSQDPVPFFLSRSFDALSRKPPVPASAGVGAIFPQQEFAAFRKRVNKHFVFVFPLCACLAKHRAPEQVLVRMPPFAGFWRERAPVCRAGLALGSARQGQSLRRGLRGVNLFGRLSFY